LPSRSRRDAVGSVLAKEEFATAISLGQHGTTFGGGPLACRVALEFFAIVEEEKLLENVNKVGEYLQQELKGLVEKRAAATGVRGRGFIQGFNSIFRRARSWTRR